jgi:hypothetical protein
MRLSTARWILAAFVICSSAIALRYRDGHDFTHNIWAPIHGLVNGLDPYDPGNEQYYDRYHVPVVAGPYTPAALTLFAPLALVSPPWAADIIALLSVAALWVGVVLLIPPRSARSYVVAAVAGGLVVLSAPAQDTIYLGQLSGFAFLGFAMIIAGLRRGPSATWFCAVGAALVSLKPQSGIPILVALAILGLWRVVGRAVLLLVVASLPGVVLLFRVVGSPATITRVVGDNLDLLTRLPPGDLTNPTNLRIDVLGLLAHLGGPALTGLLWTGVAFVIITMLFALVPRGSFDLDEVPLTHPYVATLVGAYLVGSLYHLMYDQVLLYVGPVAAIGLVGTRQDASLRQRFVAAGGLVLLGFGVMFRVGFRNLMMALDIPNLAVHTLWVTVPTLLSIAIVAGGPIYKLYIAKRSALRIIRPAPNDGGRG